MIGRSIAKATIPMIMLTKSTDPRSRLKSAGTASFTWRAQPSEAKL